MVKYFFLILGLLVVCPEISFSQTSQPTQVFTRKKSGATPKTIEQLTKNCPIVGILEDTDEIVYLGKSINTENQVVDYYFIVEIDFKKGGYKRTKVSKKQVDVK